MYHTLFNRVLVFNEDDLQQLKAIVNTMDKEDIIQRIKKYILTKKQMVIKLSLTL